MGSLAFLGATVKIWNALPDNVVSISYAESVGLASSKNYPAITVLFS